MWALWETLYKNLPQGCQERPRVSNRIGTEKVADAFTSFVYNYRYRLCDEDHRFEHFIKKKISMENAVKIFWNRQLVRRKMLLHSGIHAYNICVCYIFQCICLLRPFCAGVLHKKKREETSSNSNISHVINKLKKVSIHFVYSSYPTHTLLHSLSPFIVCFYAKLLNIWPFCYWSDYAWLSLLCCVLHTKEVVSSYR